jgi:SAM-dependent methyltransferase
MNALERWAAFLAQWAIPEQVLAAAPVSPFGFDVRTFDRAVERSLARPTPSQRVAGEALPEGGAVLDVGCGAGAASLPLAPRMGRAVGVDESAQMLAAFAGRAERLGVEHLEVQGRWPDVHREVEAADVVVCHHVLYNVADLQPFARALTEHARRRVVVEITTEHPLAWLSPLWQRLHGVSRPRRPTLEDAVAALRELELEVTIERWQQPSPWPEVDDDVVAFVRRRLCVPDERDGEIRQVLATTGLPPSRGLATLSWPGLRPGLRIGGAAH